MLDLYDLKVIEAASGEEALDAAVIGRPDLIIMDKRLPGLGSFEAIRLITLDYFAERYPDSISLGLPAPRRAPSGFAAGCDEYLVKPLDLDRLDSSLEKFLFQTPGQTCQGLK